MSYQILFKGINFILSYFKQRLNAHVAGKLIKIKKGKIRHAYYKDKKRSHVLKRKPKGYVSWTQIGPDYSL